MTETIREQVLSDIKTSLEELTIANGYNFDFTPETVQRWSMYGNSAVNLPLIVITAGDEEEKPLSGNHEECRLTVYIDAFYVHNEDDQTATDTYINRLQGDIKKRILEDETRSGTALNTSIVGSSTFETVDGQAYAGIMIELLVTYRHKRDNPAVIV